MLSWGVGERERERGHTVYSCPETIFFFFFFLNEIIFVFVTNLQI